ncbi:hypothetical protein SAM23877_6125 [Streptomyces ambofaciens ATCC 23877]|uniref:Uncharacterized protein n=1 Tax=Streptomyces ambofaciens (strain ATCC 23877 / 3486 / DSM 40053 / JCM 4204 / NBRC 12836 / NRRL B-2516) TaxID=278992 RepID=A0A0K2B1C3_STRA7|nr:hypothetical protein [Streptomyces ambofaciens]AKZ59170.1 hypothetical protein SAM23877_6125 [Streptomyces ambofaciens ATCC 23877]WNA15363.1 putative immunity repressor [Streptomyces phage Samy]
MSPKEVARLRDDAAVKRVSAASVQALDLETIENEATPTLIARGAAYAREYAAIEHKPELLAKNIAVVLLALRKRHDDWLGRMGDYRRDAAEVYSAANIRDREQLKRLQANVRYHVGNMVRRHLTPRELKALELKDASPLERQQDRRATDTAILRATKVAADVEASTPKTSKAAKKPKGQAAEEIVPTQGGGPGTGVKATADHLRLAEVAAGIVSKLDVDVIDGHMTDGQRARLDEELAEMERTVRRLRRHLKTRRSED